MAKQTEPEVTEHVPEQTSTMSAKEERRKADGDAASKAQAKDE